MLEGVRKRMGFETLNYNRLDDMLDSVGIGREKLCTYCWDGKE
jgi:amidophosphoribosyltransferase